MPLYRNHSRRSRDAPEVNRDQLNSTSRDREVNRAYTLIDAKELHRDSCTNNGTCGERPVECFQGCESEVRMWTVAASLR